MKGSKLLPRPSNETSSDADSEIRCGSQHMPGIQLQSASRPEMLLECGAVASSGRRSVMGLVRRFAKRPTVATM
jgi:hypothetical protein